MTDDVRFSVRAKPGSKGTSVGGTWGDDGALVVAVTERAVDDRANAAILELLATVLGTKKGKLRIVTGYRHRTKLIEWADPPPDAAERLDRWRRNEGCK